MKRACCRNPKLEVDPLLVAIAAGVAGYYLWLRSKGTETDSPYPIPEGAAREKGTVTLKR